MPKCINLLIKGIKREFGQSSYLQNIDKAMQYACFQTVWRTISYDTEYRRTTHKTSINSTWLIEHFKILDMLIHVFNYFKTKSDIVTCVGLNCKFYISFFNDVWYQCQKIIVWDWRRWPEHDEIPSKIVPTIKFIYPWWYLYKQQQKTQKCVPGNKYDFLQ